MGRTDQAEEKQREKGYIRMEELEFFGFCLCVLSVEWSKEEGNSINNPKRWGWREKRKNKKLETHTQKRSFFSFVLCLF